MAVEVTPSGEACGAFVTGVDLRDALNATQLEVIRGALFEHHVLCFENQSLSDDELARFCSVLGSPGEDPFLESLPGRQHMAAIHRHAEETTPIFAEAWHADWTFLPEPPQATCLYGIRIPPVGGDTLFANQQRAYAEMPEDLRAFVDGHRALHSARHTFSPSDGIHADRAKHPEESGVQVRIDETALHMQSHPFVVRHPHTHRPAVLGILEGYIVEVEDTPYVPALKMMLELRTWQTRPEFQYRHRWKANSLLIWDNYSVLHRATGGYDGHERLLHRVTLHSMPRPGAR